MFRRQLLTFISNEEIRLRTTANRTNATWHISNLIESILWRGRRHQRNTFHIHRIKIWKENLNSGNFNPQHQYGNLSSSSSSASVFSRRSFLLPNILSKHFPFSGPNSTAPAKHTQMNIDIFIKETVKSLYWLVFFRAHYFICWIWFLFEFGFINGSSSSSSDDKEQNPDERNTVPYLQIVLSRHLTSTIYAIWFTGGPLFCAQLPAFI